MAAIEAIYTLEQIDSPVTLSTIEDIDALIDELSCDTYTRRLAQLYSTARSSISPDTPDHEMMIGIDAARRVGVVSFLCPEGTFSSFRKDIEDQSVVLYFLAGSHSTEFTEDAEISIDDIRNAVKEFLITDGNRPTCIEWQSAF